MARIKSPDMPGFIKPQLATLRAKAPAGDQWLHEIKFDMVQATASSTGRHKFRPDIVVRSGPPSNNTFITDPVVVVEVLSPSTMDRDRGRKRQFYKELPTMLHIVLAYADQMRIEHYFRTENGWEFRRGGGEGCRHFLNIV